MRVAVISDIHANLHALEAVLAAIDTDPPDQIWSLGDAVGYGPHPNECCRLVRERTSLALVGNHDLVVIGEVDVAEFNSEAARAALWTRETLEPSELEYLRGLASAGNAAGVGLFHGSPRDPVWEYVLDEWTALAALHATETPGVLVGHSHVALAIVLNGDELSGGLAPAGTAVDLASRRWLLNPGSVGQPRDGDPRAAFLMLDLGTNRAAFRRVPYDVERTQSELRERGLPETLAERLATGT